MKYRLNFFANMHDNIVDVGADYTWPELVELFASHNISADKDGMMFNCCTFKTDDFSPAEYSIKDADGVVIGRAPIIKDGKQQVGRLAANVISYNCLVFDFDGGGTLDEIVTTFKSHTHLGYTSYNHEIKGVDKCRVVVPLATPISVEELRLRKRAILDFSKVDDESTLSISRAFYMPSCSAENVDKAFAWHVDGELMDWNVFECQKALPAPVPVIRSGVKTGTGKVIYETFDIVQFFKDQGLYIKPNSSGKHDVHCPNKTHDDGGTVIYEGTGMGWPRFYCSHTSCIGFNFYEHFKTVLGKGWMNDYCEREPEITMDDLINKFKINK